MFEGYPRPPQGRCLQFRHYYSGWWTLIMEQDVDSGPTEANSTVLSTQANAHRQPPPESPQSIKTRGFVILSFWAVVVLLGIPIWLWTTSIHRASLPLQNMLDWADGKVLIPSVWCTLVTEHFTGLQTYISSSNRHRSTVSARTRGSTSCSYDPARARRP